MAGREPQPSVFNLNGNVPVTNPHRLRRILVRIQDASRGAYLNGGIKNAGGTSVRDGVLRL